MLNDKFVRKLLNDSHFKKEIIGPNPTEEEIFYAAQHGPSLVSKDDTAMSYEDQRKFIADSINIVRGIKSVDCWPKVKGRVKPGFLKLIGESGSIYGFELIKKENITYELNVVFIFCRLEDKLYIPIFIGDSKEIPDILENLEKWNCVEKHGFTHVLSMFVESPEDRSNVIEDLISHYKPPCNY